MATPPTRLAATPEREVDVLRGALDRVARRLPSDWRMSPASMVGPRGSHGVVELFAPWGERLLLAVEVKRTLAVRDVSGALARLARQVETLDGPATPLLVARYLPPSVRARVEEAGASYADATGNVHVVSTKPGLLIRDRGADRDPWRGPGRPRGTLRGAPAARVVRALVDHAEPMPMTTLVAVSRASTGAAYRVVGFLEEQDLALRDKDGRVVVRSWRRLLARWSDDWSFGEHAGPHPYLAPRGVPALTEALRASGRRYALTGSPAAAHWSPYAAPRLAMVYVDDTVAASEEWGLRPVEVGANAVLAQPAVDVVFERTVDSDGISLAAPSQVAADLMSGPGRNPAEAEHLLDWMEAHEHAWRR